MSATVWPNMIYPDPTPETVNWTPAAPEPLVTDRVPSNTTLVEIRDEFGIVLGSDVVPPEAPIA